MKRIFQFLLPIMVGVSIWFTPMPLSIDPKGWQLLAIFSGTIVGLITKPLPMGAVALMSLVISVLTGTLKLEPEALGGYGSCVIWLVVYVFFIARGFIKTQLGLRIAYLFVKRFGRSALGLGYSLTLTELLIAPFIPSMAARAGGIMYPVVSAVSQSLGSYPHDGTHRKIGAFLNLVSYHGNLITSAMFLTGMAANPMIQSFAQAQGIEITWGGWALAALVPGILSLVIIPFVLYIIYPPTVKRFDMAAEIAQKKLNDMGAMSRQELLMAGIFLMMLVLWVFGTTLGINSTTTALLGLCLLLVTGILTFDDVLSEKEAWHTLIWFAILVTMARHLQIYGVIAWFSSGVSDFVVALPWQEAFAVLVLIYFYSHYVFASNTSHVSAMYAAFLAVAIATGTPPMFAALTLGFCSSLFSAMTHYGASTSPIFFGSGYVPIGRWWMVGFVVSVVHLIIWFGPGSLWYKMIGIL